MRVKVITLSFILLLIFSSNLYSRYRAYKLEIKDTLSGEIHEVTTTLSPQAYLVYYESNRAFREVSVVSTWMCWGFTGNHKKICPDPRDEESILEADAEEDSLL